MRLLLSLILVLTGCDRDAQYRGDQSLIRTAANIWPECDEKTVPLAAQNLNVGLIEVFEPCQKSKNGSSHHRSNNFTLTAWSPDGALIYFKLAQDGFVFNGETRGVWSLPTDDGLPIGEAVWVSKNQLAVPVGTSKESRLAIFNQPEEREEDITTEKLIDLNFTDARWLSRSSNPEVVLVTGLEATNTPKATQRSVYEINLQSGEQQRVFDWIKEDFDTFSFHTVQNVVFLGYEDANYTTGHNAETGEVLYRFENASRAIMGPLGQYIALEADGVPISSYRPIYTGDLTPAMERREAANRAKWNREKPDWIDEYYIPPAVDIWDIAQERRTRFAPIHGDRVEWWPGNDNNYLSFRLWGLFEQQLKPNILLADLPVRVKVQGSDTKAVSGMITIDPKTGKP